MFGSSKYPKGLELMADPLLAGRATVAFDDLLVSPVRTAVKDVIVALILSTGGGDEMVPNIEADCPRELNSELDESEESRPNSQGRLVSEVTSGDSGPSRRLLTLGNGQSTVLRPGKVGPRKKDATAREAES